MLQEAWPLPSPLGAVALASRRGLANAPAALARSELLPPLRFQASPSQPLRSNPSPSGGVALVAGEGGRQQGVTYRFALVRQQQGRVREANRYAGDAGGKR